MATALVFRFFFRRLSKPCSTIVCGLRPLSSSFGGNLLQKENTPQVKNPGRSCHIKINSGDRQLAPVSTQFSRGHRVSIGLLLGALCISVLSNSARCVGEDEDSKDDEHVGGKCETKTNFAERDSSGRFSSSKKKENAERKAAQLENILNVRKQEAKRKLTLESDDEEPQNGKKITRSSLVSKLKCCNIFFSSR